MSEIQTDFPELEGVVIDNQWIEENTISKARVAGCCYHVGITLVDVEDGSEQLCLNHKLYTEGKSGRTMAIYNRRFYGIVHRILEGSCLSDDYDSIYDSVTEEVAGRSPHSGGMVSCAFK